MLRIKHGFQKWVLNPFGKIQQSCLAETGFGKSSPHLHPSFKNMCIQIYRWSIFSELSIAIHSYFLERKYFLHVSDPQNTLFISQNILHRPFHVFEVNISMLLNIQHIWDTLLWAERNNFKNEKIWSLFLFFQLLQWQNMDDPNLRWCYIFPMRRLNELFGLTGIYEL